MLMSYLVMKNKRAKVMTMVWRSTRRVKGRMAARVYGTARPSSLIGTVYSNFAVLTDSCPASRY